SSFLSHDDAAHLTLHSFPTLRSSDLRTTSSARGLAPPGGTIRSRRGTWGRRRPREKTSTIVATSQRQSAFTTGSAFRSGRRRPRDRKSTRLNSSHRTTSYAVFCMQKK